MDKIPSHKKVGPIIASLIIILILVVAAVYVFASRVNQQAKLDKEFNEALKSASSSAVHTYTIQRINSTSTDPRALQNDLEKATEGLDL